MKPQPWLAPLSPIYAAVLRAKNFAYDQGIFPAMRLRGSVISVGNLSTGGGGKTPVVIAMAGLLRSAGIAVDVLSRGYGRSSTTVERVVPDGPAEQYGDEPLLIAQAAGVPVFVGSSRFAAGRLAEQDALRVHLLDDGFQHRQLARDLDVVVVHRTDLSARGLPAGPQREPLSSLARAHVVVLREEDAELAADLETDAEVWRVRRKLVCAVPGGTVVAFCGIARPDEFFAGLRRIGVDIAATLAFADHHRYMGSDLKLLLEEVRRVDATSLVTTEKDAARLGLTARAMLEASIALTIAKLEVSLLEPELVMATVRRVIRL